MTCLIPNTEDERKLMLEAIGVGRFEELLHDIPQKLRLTGELKLPGAMSEYELSMHMKAIAAENINADTHVCFMGGGVYDHYIPAAVGHLAGRQEFYTAYTPYQAEISRGTLQAIFEYQTLMTRLTGEDVSNASVYDGATACAEAMLLAHNANEKNEVIILGSLNPEYAGTCRTYAGYRNLKIAEAMFDSGKGTVDMASLKALINENTSSIIMQSPNYFGIIEDIDEISQVAHSAGLVLIVATNPISLGILKPPGEMGADIVVGEGQPLGNQMSYGGPGFGFFTCKKDYLRKMPGRIVGETTDKDGRRGYVLTMQAREQHIRREKATSNICSNQALNALRASIYLSLLGEHGFREVSELCCKKAHYLYDGLISTGMFKPRFDAPFFNEFVVSCGRDMKSFIKSMTESGVLPGIDLSDIPGLEDCLLVAVTEKRTKSQLDDYIWKAGETV